MILAGDIGGTNARLCLFTSRGGALSAVATHQYATQDFESLEKIVTCFVNKYGHKISCACFGVAGPVIAGRSQGVNMAWPVDQASLAQALSGIPVTVINDLVANANGLPQLVAQEPAHAVRMRLQHPGDALELVVAELALLDPLGRRGQLRGGRARLALSRAS